MSYDIDFCADVGADELVLLQGGDRNYTSNVVGIWAEAIGEEGKGLGQIIDEHPLASDLLPLVARGAATIRANPARFKHLEPANGWGDTAGALEILEWIADRCREWPKAIVRAGR